jgi:hypothetical protein
MQGKQGALGLQQTSQFKQHRPIFPEHPALVKSRIRLLVFLLHEVFGRKVQELLPVGIVVVSTVGATQSATEDDVFLVNSVVRLEKFVRHFR